MYYICKYTRKCGDSTAEFVVLVFVLVLFLWGYVKSLASNIIGPADQH